MHAVSETLPSRPYLKILDQKGERIGNPVWKEPWTVFHSSCEIMIDAFIHNSESNLPLLSNDVNITCYAHHFNSRKK